MFSRKESNILSATKCSFARKALLRVAVNIDLPVRLGQPHFFLKIHQTLR